MLLFYLITFLHGSYSLPFSLLEGAETKVNKTKHNDLLTEIKSNPQQFISEVQNLDPVAVRNIIALLEDVLDKSEEREKVLVDDLANKDSALSDANDDVIGAEDALHSGEQAVEEQRIVVRRKQEIVSEAKRVLSIEQDVLDDKTHDVDVAQEDLHQKIGVHELKRAEKEASKKAHDDEIPDLNDEQQILRDVMDMLQGLHDKEAEKRYIIGPKTGCDGGQIQISNWEDCQEAAEALGVRYWGGQGHSSGADPKGCIYRTGGDIYFNSHSTGSLNRNDRKLVCTPVNSLVSCTLGQGASDGPQLDQGTNFNSRNGCQGHCLSTVACVAFDFTTIDQSNACRIYSSMENPRTDPGAHERQWCVKGE